MTFNSRDATDSAKINSNDKTDDTANKACQFFRAEISQAASTHNNADAAKFLQAVTKHLVANNILPDCVIADSSSGMASGANGLQHKGCESSRDEHKDQSSEPKYERHREYNDEHPKHKSDRDSRKEHEHEHGHEGATSHTGHHAASPGAPNIVPDTSGADTAIPGNKPGNGADTAPSAPANRSDTAIPGNKPGSGADPTISGSDSGGTSTTPTPGTPGSIDNSGLPSSLDGQGYSQVFNSKFASGGLSQFVNGAFKWGSTTNAANNEAETYTVNNAIVENGNLVLYPTSTGNGKYNSGIVSTKEAFTGGVFSMAAKLPPGGDTWPSFWLVPQNLSWPPEIDVMEALGNGTGSSGTDSSSNSYHVNNHYTNGSGSNGQTGGWVNTDGILPAGQTLSNSYNTYTVDWQPGKSLTYYLNGHEVSQTTQNVPDQPMYMIANLAMGGWAAGGDGGATTTGAGGGMDVSSIIAYQKAGETNTAS